jgi:hypothetical protein
MGLKIPDAAKPYIERVWRGAVAAEVAVYVSGNLVFDVTHVGVSLEHILAIAVGGAASALGLSVAGNVVSGNGPSFTKAEQVVTPPPS